MYNACRGGSAVVKIEIKVLNTNFLKVLCVVNLFVQADQSIDAESLEEVDVRRWRVSLDVVAVGRSVGRRRTGHNLSRDDPVQVTVFHAFIVLVPAEVRK